MAGLNRTFMARAGKSANNRTKVVRCVQSKATILTGEMSLLFFFVSSTIRIYSVDRWSAIIITL